MVTFGWEKPVAPFTGPTTERGGAQIVLLFSTTEIQDLPVSSVNHLLVCAPLSWLEASAEAEDSVRADPLASPGLFSDRGGLKSKRGNEEIRNRFCVEYCNNKHFKSPAQVEWGNVRPERGDSGEVVVDVEHGSVQQRVNIVKAL